MNTFKVGDFVVPKKDLSPNTTNQIGSFIQLRKYIKNKSYRVTQITDGVYLDDLSVGWHPDLFINLGPNPTALERELYNIKPIIE